MKSLRIRLVRSPIGAKPRLRRTVAALGLRRMRSAVVLQSTPAVEGMVRAVSHLVEVEELAATASKSAVPTGAAKQTASKTIASVLPAGKKPAGKKPAGKKPATQKPKE